MTVKNSFHSLRIQHLNPVKPLSTYHPNLLIVLYQCLKKFLHFAVKSFLFVMLVQYAKEV